MAQEDPSHGRARYEAVAHQRLSEVLAGLAARLKRFPKPFGCDHAPSQERVSQSALSTAITELERQLGLQIFERDNKKVLVTQIGKQVLQKAHNIILQVGDLHALSYEQQAPLSYPLSLGVIPTIAPFLLPLVLPELAIQYPNLELQVLEEQSGSGGYQSEHCRSDGSGGL